MFWEAMIFHLSEEGAPPGGQAALKLPFSYRFPVPAWPMFKSQQSKGQLELFSAPATVQTPWEDFGMDLESQVGTAGEAQKDTDAGNQKRPNRTQATRESAVGLD